MFHIYFEEKFDKDVLDSQCLISYINRGLGIRKSWVMTHEDRTLNNHISERDAAL